MKNLALIIVVIALLAGAYLVYKNNVTNIQEEALEVQAELAVEEETQTDAGVQHALENGPSVTPISHASLVLTWNERTIYVDPVGEVELYTDLMAPDLVLITDVHGDHLSATTLEGVISGNSLLVVPQAVYDLLPESLQAQAVVIANGETTEQLGFAITGVPMYNVPEADDAYHVKGRGNGYILEAGETRVYIAGDTGNTPEMRALTDIDMAFVPMNLPFTMTVEDAADAVLAFAPATAIPYHYRGREGLSDVTLFQSLVEAGDPRINVLLLNWYPESEPSDEEETLETES